MKYSHGVFCLATLFWTQTVHSSINYEEDILVHNSTDTTRSRRGISDRHFDSESDIFNNSQQLSKHGDRRSEDEGFPHQENSLNTHMSDIDKKKRKKSQHVVLKRQVNKHLSNETGDVAKKSLITKITSGIEANNKYNRTLDGFRYVSYMISYQRNLNVWSLFGPDTDEPPPLVQTAEGTIRGKRINKYGVKYFSFEGVPYATAPERFKAPQPLKPWTGIKDTLRPSSPCSQKNALANFYFGSEDCLYLNLHTPSIGDTKLSVFVVIHGGGFNYLSGATEFYGPERFIEKDIVVISINYRLGALGFLSTETTEAPGNAGMKDMIAALTWIQKNVHMFGGDPSKITLFGSSSGATAVEFLTLSKMSKGLFTNTMTQSGSALNYWFYQKDPIKYAIRLGKYLGCHTTNVHKLMTALKNATAEEIVEASQKIGYDVVPLGLGRPFSVSVEKPLPDEDMFLHDHPDNIFRSGDFMKLPSIVGFNTMEGSEFIRGMLNDSDFFNSIDNTFEYLLPSDLLYAMETPQQRRALINEVRQFYLNGGQISNATAKGFIDFIGDGYLLYGLFESINLRLQKSDEPIYFWQFAYEGELGNFRKFNDIDVEGVPHADESGYLFRVGYLDGFPVSYETDEVARRIVSMASNFMKYGNPTPIQTRLLPVTWMPLERNGHMNYLEINETMVMKQDPQPYMDRMAFWKKLYTNKHNLFHEESTHHS